MTTGRREGVTRKPGTPEQSGLRLPTASQARSCFGPRGDGTGRVGGLCAVSGPFCRSGAVPKLGADSEENRGRKGETEGGERNARKVGLARGAAVRVNVPFAERRDDGKVPAGAPRVPGALLPTPFPSVSRRLSLCAQTLCLFQVRPEVPVSRRGGPSARAARAGATGPFPAAAADGAVPRPVPGEQRRVPVSHRE